MGRGGFWWASLGCTISLSNTLMCLVKPSHYIVPAMLLMLHIVYSLHFRQIPRQLIFSCVSPQEVNNSNIRRYIFSLPFSPTSHILIQLWIDTQLRGNKNAILLHIVQNQAVCSTFQRWFRFHFATLGQRCELHTYSLQPYEDSENQQEWFR